MQVPEYIVEEIRLKADIVDVIGEVVDLKKRGSNFIGLCPFHNEKTPSFTVSQDKGIYKCFGCGVSGNVFGFMMNYFRLSYPESLKELAKRYGVYIPAETASRKDAEKSDKIESIYKLLAAAAEFYSKTLLTTSGKFASQNLHNRGFSRETIEQFKLGYSPDSWDATFRELMKSGYSKEILLEAGLIIEKEDKSSFYDRFRNRLMFPIQDSLGRITGFGARQLADEENQPKYINSPQTAVYDKSRSLYGIYQAKYEIRQKKAVILAEGYADVITLHQAGYKNSIASSGTSLTREQLDILKSYCKNIYIAYDSDPAGIKAADRAVDIALEYGFSIHIVRLPKGEDPDSLIKNNGNDIFRAYLDDAVSFIDFKYSLLEDSGNLSNPEAKAEASRNLVRLISKIPDRLIHDDYIKRLSSLMNLSESQLQRIYKEKSHYEKSVKFKQQKESNQMQEIRAVEPHKNHPEISAKSKPITLRPEEILLIFLSLINPDAFKILTKNFSFGSLSFHTDDGKRLFGIIEQLYSKNREILNTLMDDSSVSNEDRHFLTSLALGEYKINPDWEKYRTNIPRFDIERSLRDSIVKLNLYQIELQIEEIKSSHMDKSVENQLDDLSKLNPLLKERAKILELLNYGKC